MADTVVAMPKKAFALKTRSRPTTSTTSVWLRVMPNEVAAAATNPRTMTWESSTTSVEMSAAVARPHTAKVTLVQARSVRRSARSARTPPNTARTATGIAGSPLASPTQASESVIESTSQACAIVRRWKPTMPNTLSSSRYGKRGARSVATAPSFVHDGAEGSLSATGCQPFPRAASTGERTAAPGLPRRPPPPRSTPREAAA